MKDDEKSPEELLKEFEEMMTRDIDPDELYLRTVIIDSPIQ